MQKITDQGKRRFLVPAAGVAVLLAFLGGCAHTSGDAERPGVEYGSAEPAAGAQKETELPAAAAPEGITVFLDEKLDENLFICAELHMPERELYEYAAQLKTYDYENVQAALGQSEGSLTVSDGSDEFTGGSLRYQRNDMAGHLDTYCSYAEELGLAEDRDLSFLSRADAAAEVQSFIEKLEVGGEPEILSVTAMDQADFEYVKEAMLQDDAWQGVLSAKGYESDTFDEGMEVYRILFRMNVNGIPVYRNEPELRGTSERFLAYPVTITALLSGSGIEMITMTGMYELYDGQQRAAAIIGGDGIREAIMKKFGDVILTSEFWAKNVWMEYFPLLREDSFTELDLIPVWCVDFEIDGQSVEDSRYTLRFHAVTGEEIS